MSDRVAILFGVFEFAIESLDTGFHGGGELGEVADQDD
jgi:hypothetical protein